MAKVRALIVHDEIGRIISIARPASDAQVVVSAPGGQSALETEIDEDIVFDMIAGSHRVDIRAQTLVTNEAPNSRPS